MRRNVAILAVVALLVAGTSAALAGDVGPTATSDAPLAQDTETTTVEEETVAEDETTVAADGETTTAANGITTTTTEDRLTGENATASVTFLNQTAGMTFVEETPNDTTVLVERAVLPEGGFVVIHAAENVSGEYQPAENVSIGAVLGNSTYLGPGDHANVVVQLDSPLNESQTLVAMAHQDTNDNQEYDFPEADAPYTFMDSPVTQSGYIIVTDSEGQIIAGDETATEDAETVEETVEETGANETTTTEA